MRKGDGEIITVTLAGNPNVGKSTLFNSLTGMRQHTGNWPGKTVEIAQGSFTHRGREYRVVDLPGTYSLEGASEDERLAGAYISEGHADCTVVVCDGTCLERSLILALQVLMRNSAVIVCVNLLDEATRRGLVIDRKRLETCLDVPVVTISAGQGEGIERLLNTLEQELEKPPRLYTKQWRDPIRDAERIAAGCVSRQGPDTEPLRRKVDRLFASRRFGIPLMYLILLSVVWLTVRGANYPSMLMENLFDWVYDALNGWLGNAGWLGACLLDGVYLTSARVISVMLPPMLIFFPLFTVLEDIGYLPRMAFLLDAPMARCGGCGKQALTLCMGLGCNAVGVTGCRIIDSPRERLCAMITNAMVPCNGRFPTLILLGSLFFSGSGAALVVAACVALGVVGAMVSSGILAKTLLRGQVSTFLMEIPPFRRPRLGKILVRSLLDRTLFVAGRALCVAAPAGLLFWFVSHTELMPWIISILDPLGFFMGMNGVILFAFIFSLPANELLIPIILLVVTGAGSLRGVPGNGGEVLSQFMSLKTAVCTMAFTLFHWPCGTTLLTVYRETRCMKKTAAAFLLPTAVGVIICVLLNWIF